MHSNHNWILINLFWVSWCGGCHSAKTQLVSFVLMLCFVKAGTPTPVKTLLETVNLNLFRHKLHYIWKKQKNKWCFLFLCRYYMLYIYLWDLWRTGCVVFHCAIWLKGIFGQNINENNNVKVRARAQFKC